MRFGRIVVLGLLVLGGSGEARAFDVEEYQRFLEGHVDMSAGELEGMYPVGMFERLAPTDFGKAAYADSVDYYYELTDGEKELLGRHGFVVTERVRPISFGRGFLEVYHRDLPVFVSTDAILHALHMSYDAILIDLEMGVLRPRLEQGLELLHEELREMTVLADPAPGMLPVMRDVDLYLTVPRRLLGLEVEPVFAENAGRVRDLLGMVAAEKAGTVDLFGQSGRQVDFSQFTPRGHYTDRKELTEYFRAMIWLGRIELYLRAPKGVFPPVSEEAVRHQATMAVYLAELAEGTGAGEVVAEIDRALRGLVGEQDNATLEEVRALAWQVNGAGEMLEDAGWERFEGALEESEIGGQKILSQILSGDPLAPERIEPAAVFMLLGQRFVVDSYVTGNVVYDRIQYLGENVFRGLPSTLDVLFALGNDAALPLLKGELEEYGYARNLAALRYLIDGFEETFWEETFYNGWLGAIRTLRPPVAREGLPGFMRTGAWWQEKMNSQLAAWAQLRHDNLLYAKQSYTGGVACSYPAGYVEPIPEFYRRVGTLAGNAAVGLVELFEEDYQRERIGGYFREMAAIADTLEGIAEKELAGEELNEGERRFLQTVIYDLPEGCAPVYRGWYARLFYTGEQGFMTDDLVVADVHTQPTDGMGNPVGHVLHAGTGPLNTAVVVAAACEGVETAFVGPVMSYYEHVSLNFKRLTDEEWALAYGRESSFRPEFTRAYLADAEGVWQGAGVELPTTVETAIGGTGVLPEAVGLSLAPGYPNPFNASTLIRFSVGRKLSGALAVLTVFNQSGQVVRRLVDRHLEMGHYSVRWDGKDEEGLTAASGVYTYLLEMGGQRASGRVSLVK